MPPEPSTPKEYLTLYRDGSLGCTLIEAIDELMNAGRFPFLPGAAPDNPINLVNEPAGSEAANPLDLITITTTTSTSSSSPRTGKSTSASASTSTSSSSSPPRQPKPQPQPQQQQDVTPLTHKLINCLLTTFDRMITQTLATHDDVVKKSPAIKMKGKLKQYRLVDDIWKLWVEDVEIAVGSEKRRRRRRTTAKGRGDGRENPAAKGDGSGKRKSDEVDGEDGREGEERIAKRRKGEGGEARAVDGGEDQAKENARKGHGGGPEVIKVDRMLIVACDGRREGAGDGKNKKRGG
ncbi:hypothetical protein QBC32DRAFT_402879 [Pseudoneurospora amorphoporcata]|uniref:Uncharacterized protein n=1 Tax=Pseudoneurospora amorphoporcata TaxID=241081 RepID=A0AAN6P1S2_9PEZI|nr:hypothetical protein QBC32DRAFT_402879 [Pseudoneurospora amorphoporcata]